LRSAFLKLLLTLPSKSSAIFRNYARAFSNLQFNPLRLKHVLLVLNKYVVHGSDNSAIIKK
jgi:hypothetical protein